jgi:glycosyltransferase involved in cell wall biosynthesis
MPVRICLDISAAVHGRAGIGRYTQELTKSLVEVAPEATFTAFYNRSAEARPASPVDRIPRLTVPWGDKPWRLRVLLAHMIGLSQDRLFPGIDLFHATDHLLPRLERVPAVFTLYDLTYLLTDTHTTLNRLFLTWMMPRFLQRARAIIAVSQCTRQDLLRHYAVEAGKVHVIYGGVNPCFRPASDTEIAQIRRQYGLPERFILAVGTLEPRKNYGVLLAAYRSLLDEGLQAGLVIAGRKGWRYAEFYRQLARLGLKERVQILGSVADQDLPALYSAAHVFAFPSLYEGFGLPPLEAMACATPVVASSASSIPEVVGSAGLTVEPHDVNGLARAIAAILSDDGLRAGLRAAGPRQARQFTWERAARETLQVYDAVLSS